MDKANQKRIVRELLKAYERDVCKKINQRKIPEEWDGIELRELLGDMMSEQRWMANNIRARPHYRVRLREYRRTRISRGL